MHFVSLAARQWRREDDVDCILGELSPTNRSKYKVAPKYDCLHDLLGVMPLVSMSDALSTARPAVREERGGELREGGPCQGALSISFLLAVTLNNVVTPPHNHQTGSIQFKLPLEVDSFGTGSNSHSANQFRCRRDESSFTPCLHL